MTTVNASIAHSSAPAEKPAHVAARRPNDDGTPAPGHVDPAAAGTTYQVRLVLLPGTGMPRDEMLRAQRLRAGHYRLLRTSALTTLASGDEVITCTDRQGHRQIVGLGPPGDRALSVVETRGLDRDEVRAIATRWRSHGAISTRVWRHRLTTTWEVDADDACRCLRPALHGRSGWHLVGVYAPHDRTRRLVGATAHLP